MPLKYFYCPDRTKIPISECLKGCPRPEGECLPPPTRFDAGSARQWKGRPSTTQCINPTRLEYLKIKYDYAIDPHDMAFALLGTQHHTRLELVATHIELMKTEVFLKNADTTGIADLLHPDPQNDGKWILTDYKTWGSVAVAKFLGFGKFNGDRSRFDLEMQLNNYRIMAEAAGFPVSKLQVQVTVRDGGLAASYKNKVDFKMGLFPVNILDDDDVIEYFMDKSQALINAVNNNEMPPLCPYEERWGGNRCKGYCDVFRFCPEGAKINRVELEG